MISTLSADTNIIFPLNPLSMKIKYNKYLSLHLINSNQALDSCLLLLLLLLITTIF